MELTVKDFKKALSNVDENKIVYVEGGFGRSDIHVVYDIRELSNGNIMVNIDGCCGEDDREKFTLPILISSLSSNKIFLSFPLSIYSNPK